jgi:hypothetical protein
MGITGCKLLLQADKHQQKREQYLSPLLIEAMILGIDVTCTPDLDFASTCVASWCACLFSPSLFIFREASGPVRRLIRFLHRKEGIYVGLFHLELTIAIFDPHPSHYEAFLAYITYITSCVDREGPTTGNIARESEWSTC